MTKYSRFLHPLSRTGRAWFTCISKAIKSKSRARTNVTQPRNTSWRTAKSCCYYGILDIWNRRRQRILTRGFQAISDPVAGSGRLTTPLSHTTSTDFPCELFNAETALQVQYDNGSEAIQPDLQNRQWLALTSRSGGRAGHATHTRSRFNSSTRTATKLRARLRHWPRPARASSPHGFVFGARRIRCEADRVQLRYRRQRAGHSHQQPNPIRPRARNRPYCG